jgi:hypothetical protein
MAAWKAQAKIQQHYTIYDDPELTIEGTDVTVGALDYS